MVDIKLNKNIKRFYNTYEKWCKGHKFPALKGEMLDLTFILYKDKVPMYSCFLWETRSTSCVLGFPLSNPEIPYKEREGLLDKLIEHIVNYSRLNGYKLIWTTSGTERVENSLKNNGFIIGDVKVDQYLKHL